MDKKFMDMLAVGGKSNSLGKVKEVIEIILEDKSRLSELYDCLFDNDAWVRMRAADALEKVCREHPEWLLIYMDKFTNELAESTQASIQWHLAQIYAQVSLTNKQRRFAIKWLKQLISTIEVDWIVAANAINTLALFTRNGSVSAAEMIPLLKIQQKHKSNAVVKRANKLLSELSAD